MLSPATFVVMRGLRHGAVRGVLGLLMHLALGVLFSTTAGAQPQPSYIEPIIQAKSLASSDPAIPDMALQALTPLPDDWSLTRPRAVGSVWYRAAFEKPALAAADELLALYIERVCSNVEVHLNGRYIFSSGRVPELFTRDCTYPQLVALPAALLRDDGNVLDLRVRGQTLQRVSAVQRAGGLSTLKVGPQAALAVEHDSAFFWRVSAVQMASGVIAVLGGVMLVLGWARRREGHEWVLGWLLLGWSLLSARLWLRETPLDNALVEFLASAGLALLTALAVVFLLRYARWAFRPLEVGLFVQCLVMPLSMLLAGPNWLHAMSTVWTLLLAIEVFVAMGLYLVLTWPQRRADFWVMAPILAGTAILLLVELALQRHLLDLPVIDRTQLGLSLALVVLAVRVLAQHAGGAAVDGAAATQPRGPAEAAADKKKSLESRLHELAATHERTLAEVAVLRAEAKKAQEKAQEMTLERKRAAAAAPEVNAEAERTLAHMAELRVEQVTAQERKRIAADLHDDLGAKLLTIVHTSESDHISTLAREALEEMRLSVRGLSGKPMRLADALADWRAETVARLSQANIEIDWRSPTEETDQRLAARSFVQTTRILREAVSNIIKHSGASQCKVRCGIREKEFGLVVQDNGNGISMELDGNLDRGHGMASMKNRAKQMQGQCLVESGPGYGTVIRLTLPL